MNSEINQKDAEYTAKQLLKTDGLLSKTVDVGYYFYEDKRGGNALIVGNDGGVLFANTSVTPDEHIEAYKQGKRTDPVKLEKRLIEGE